MKCCCTSSGLDPHASDTLPYDAEPIAQSLIKCVGVPAPTETGILEADVQQAGQPSSSEAAGLAPSSEDATSAASSTPATLVVETPTKLTGLVEPASASASGLEDSLPAPSLPEATSDGADDQAQVEQPLREVTSDSAEVEQEAAASMHPGAGDGGQGDGDDISTRMPMQIALELPASGAGDTAGNFSVLDYMVACLHEGAVVMSGVFL